MTSIAPAPASNPQKNLGLQPDDPVWVRYSPHGELPLSSVTSFVIHGLVIGLACLAIWSVSRFLDHPTRALPIQTVQLAGGGGDPEGVAGGTGTGTAGMQEAGPEQPTEAGAEVGDPEPVRPNIAPVDKPSTPVTPEPNAKPTMQSENSMQAFNALREQSAQMVQASKAGPKGQAKSGPKGQGGPRAKGKGGPGEGGGEGTGRGPGKGAGRGDGAGTQNLTRTQKRMLRWAMLFDTHTGPEYIRQLAGLGAVLAFPVKNGSQGTEYRVVTNRNLLHPPARLVKEDLSKYKGIRWTDNNPESVAQVMQTLGLRLPADHFIAFMPPPLEERLAQLEKKFANRAEEDIYETRFRIIFTGAAYTPVVIDQTPKSAAPAE